VENYPPLPLLSIILSTLLFSRDSSGTAEHAMVVSRLATMQQGARTDITGIPVMSQPEAAAMLNVSADSVQFAKKVLDQGSKELIGKVDRGEIAVSTPATIAELERLRAGGRDEKELKSIWRLDNNVQWLPQECQKG
jgi:hypothetical protein